jgi:carbamoyltransferase
MEQHKPTLAIYGIKDRGRYSHPISVHDHNLCLMQDGKVLQYLQLERFTRKKYDNRLDEFLEDLINRELLHLPKEFDMVSVNALTGNAFISKDGRIRFESESRERLDTAMGKAFAWYQFDEWEGKEVRAYNCPHELAHIASNMPFFGNFKNNSLLIHFDGGASVCNFAAFHYKDGTLRLLEHHWKLSYLSKFFNDNTLTFTILGANRNEHCSIPGKLMGYACMGNYNPKIEQWLFSNGYFKDYWNKQTNILQSVKSTFGLFLSDFDNHQSFWQDVAATFQCIFERDFIAKICRLQEAIHADYLYYAGGCALNIVTNTKLLQKNVFSDVFIPPCCNDSGLSLGAASWLEQMKGNTISPHSPYLCNVGLNTQPSISLVDSSVVRQVAETLMAGGIVGVCNGAAEVGPRALGNRSLIALANDKSIAVKLSMNVKKREWYRPVAPVMLREIAEEVTTQPLHHLSRFMLLDFHIKREYEKDLSGVIHINQTARIQSIGCEEENPFMFRLLRHLYEQYHILALINTSFNVQGEPIVHTTEEAFISAKKMQLQGVVINHVFYKI